MRFPSALRALNHRDYRLFWLGQSVSVVGSWMQSIGLSWLVLELTGSPIRLGLVSALQFGPLLLLSVVAGVVVDRSPTRRLVLSTQLALMLPAFALAGLVWTGWIRYWHVATLAGVIGVVNALDMPSRQSFTVEMVGRDDLMNALALNSAAFNAARVTGPALGGYLIAHYGTAVAFLLNGLSYLTVIAALVAIRTGSAAGPRRDTTVRQEVLDGLRYATRTPVVASILSIVGAVSMFALNHGVLVPLFAREVLGEEVRGFGFLMASLGAGAVAGAVVGAISQRRPPMAAVFGLAMGVAVGVLALAFVRQFAAGGRSTVPDRRHADRVPERQQHHRPGHGSGRAPGARHGRLHDGLRRRHAGRRVPHRVGGGSRGRARRLRRRRRARARRRPDPGGPVAPGQGRLRMTPRRLGTRSWYTSNATPLG